ncbi:hypothetical protein AWM75_07210 [Aerococcus urinaehominis]|uniref:UPF0473 protein AWM75_07210 n=1 Tax=Aerococcus urinaehominis TaxID=128944 RepID=A0A0X8FLZ2_9LACT|nr:DUF1292 domain-containing protein [Aerococcus urinaehominis]AMB99763.1 hypothetical protein AWM75_07210 [Aerococcus urinaehominis]SDM09912.1 Uncharacterized protein YrzB, UPF0473 family [Aerococcus urinaehominis]
MSQHTHDHEHDHNHDHNHAHDHEHEHITIVDEAGNEQLYEILLTFHSDDHDKSYVVVYPAGAGEDEAVEVSAFAYIEDEDEMSGQLLPIETDEEWDMVEEVLNTFVEEEE